MVISFSHWKGQGMPARLGRPGIPLIKESCCLGPIPGCFDLILCALAASDLDPARLHRLGRHAFGGDAQQAVLQSASPASTKSASSAADAVSGRATIVCHGF